MRIAWLPLLILLATSPAFATEAPDGAEGDAPVRAPNERPSVICFTPGTRLRTERGEVAIEDLDVGDRLLTRDDGAQGFRPRAGRRRRRRRR